MIDRRRGRRLRNEAELPPELRDLDRELRSLRIEERPSFGPELEAKLAREWERIPRRRSGRFVRFALAASLGGLMVVGLSVPSARAAISRFIQAVIREEPRESAAPEPPAVTDLQAEDPGALEDAELSTRTVVAPPPVDPEQPPLERSSEWPPPESGMSFPEILDRETAEARIRRFYPDSLQRAGIGGTIRLLLWVDSAGEVDHIQMRRGSGILELDRAALLAARELHFSPARRFGEPVGTWVEFEVHFVPPPLPDGPSGDPGGGKRRDSISEGTPLPVG